MDEDDNAAEDEGPGIDEDGGARELPVGPVEEGAADEGAWVLLACADVPGAEDDCPEDAGVQNDVALRDDPGVEVETVALVEEDPARDVEEPAAELPTEVLPEEEDDEVVES